MVEHCERQKQQPTLVVDALYILLPGCESKYSHGIFLTRSDVQNIVSTIIVDTWAALRELTNFSRDARCG